MPEFPVELRQVTGEETSLVVTLNKLPKRGSWFDLGDGDAAKVEDVRVIGGEPVIFAVRGEGRLVPRSPKK
jgi:hypothetical protein